MKGIILASSVYLACLMLFAVGAPGWPLVWVLVSASLLTCGLMLVVLLAAAGHDAPVAETADKKS